MDNFSYEVVGFQDKINLAIPKRIGNRYQLKKAKDNFFIWKKGTTSNYIRLALQRAGENYFVWDLETSFKPYNYKHNHRQDAHIRSEIFKDSENEKAYNYFLNLLGRVA